MRRVKRNSAFGTKGEDRIVRLVKCPNCDAELTKYPPNRPLIDVRCVNCEFKAQLKISTSKPKSEIFGSGWDIMDKFIKSGYLIPPLIVLFKWKTEKKNCEKIIFFPFLNRKNLKMRTLSKRARRAGYRMFNYVALDDAAQIVLKDC